MRISVLVALLLVASQRADSLGAEILRRNLPAPADAAALDLPITSYAVLDDSLGFVIAYYHLKPDSVPSEIHIRSYELRTRTWRHVTLREPIGSILSIHRGGRILYVTGHTSPSATPTLVLTDNLDVKRELDGWPALVLRDGRVVFERSMVHFAPAHAAALALYDPATNREASIYPDASVRNERGIEHAGAADVLQDRSIDAVKAGPEAGTIQFDVIEQPMRVSPYQSARPEAPEQRFVVQCAIRAESVVCTKQKEPRISRVTRITRWP